MKEKWILKSGALASLSEALAYVFGFAIMAFYLNPPESSKGENTVLLFFLKKKVCSRFGWLSFTCFLVSLFLNSALRSLLKSTSEHDASTIASFGNIWAVLVIASGMIAIIGIDVVDSLAKTNINEASALWTTLDTLQNGLGGGVEIIGGILVLLISVMGLKHGILSKYLHWLGLLIAISGILTIMPMLKALGAIFGILQIFWFTALGLGLWRKAKNPH
jgi:hypothetical protein